MREIKFKLIDGTGKIVGYEKWYSGNFNNQDGVWLAKPQWLYSKDNKYWVPIYIWHTNKLTFTGLKDKEGKEIYESDLVVLFGNKLPRPVIWGTIEHYGWSLSYPNHREKPINSSLLQGDFEVIGNIHQNPELLND